jgi:16S rRNA (cytidine1402-2'-O)-methyltransferase
MAGTLYVVATPIGNLEDLTFRARRVLGEVAIVAAEDTRRTAKLLAHYGIRTPLLSVREHNEAREAPKLIRRLSAGESVALVTDAGTPGIADPGARLVRSAHEAGIAVVPIPGASAVAAALSVSGISADEFTFMGFPPPSGTERGKWFDRLLADSRPAVFFEAPHRIQRTLSELRPSLVDRQISIMRELTKRHESVVIRPNMDLSSYANALGEFTVVVGPRQEQSDEAPSKTEVALMFGRLTELAGLTDSLALELTAHAFRIGPSSVRNAVKKHRILVKRHIHGVP